MVPRHSGALEPRGTIAPTQCNLFTFSQCFLDSALEVLTDFIIDIVRNAIGNAMVWPKQIVVPFLGPEPSPDDDIEGVLAVTLVRAKDLMSGSGFLGQSLFTRSPHAVLQIGDDKYTSHTEHDTTTPRWNETFKVLFHVTASVNYCINAILAYNI